MSPASVPRRTIGAATASLGLAIGLLAVANRAFWSRLWDAVDPTAPADFALLGGIALMLLALLWALVSLLAWPRVAKPAWIALVVVAAGAACVMDRYGIIIDRVAVQSLFETDPREAGEWLGAGVLAHALPAALAAWAIWRLPLRFAPMPRLAMQKIVACGVAIGTLALGASLAFQPLASLARNHRELPHLINPTAAIQATFGYARRQLAPRPSRREPVGEDARVGARWAGAARPHVLVIVIGESARASSFGILGYVRDTTPRLARSGAVAFGEVAACGTSTAVSLPCLFSGMRTADYSDRAARARESLLDVLRHAGLEAQWFDNNTGSKGASRPPEEHDLGASGGQDDVLVAALHAQLAQPVPPAVIVLHQKGSHGPSYFEHYPPAFRRFAPTCDSNDLGDCSAAQIVNTYDNTIFYTDHVLASVIDELRAEGGRLDAAMLYVSDHGESTGEHGLFLHGAPRFMAPSEQTRVPMIAWLSDGFALHAGVDRGCLAARRATPLSHDHFYHSILGLLDVHTALYDASLDLFAPCRDAGSRLAAH